MNRHEAVCNYCDTACIVEFDDEDDLLTFCPACGEEYVDLSDEDQLEFWEDEDPDGDF